MRYGWARAAVWIFSFLALASAPMFLGWIGPTPPRGLGVEIGVALGFVGLGLLALQFLLTGRYRRVATSFGLDSMLQFHREMGMVAVLFVLAHPAVLFVTDLEYLEYLDPRVNLMRALALVGGTGALLLLTATSLWRLAFHLSYERWRLVHGVLASIVIVVGVAHILQVGHYVAEPWKRALFVLIGAGSVGLLLNTRVLRPWRNRGRRYRVESVREERGDAATLVLVPDGHEGMRFLPGQFAWLTLGASPFSLQQHPYSFSSSAEAAPRQLEFTVKEEGDGSAAARAVEPGSSAFLEGPFGYFVPRRDSSIGCVLIAGGVGVTPCRSMLRTFSDREDPRELCLIYANPTLADTIFYEELQELEGALNLRVVFVLEEPPEEWSGEVGVLTDEILARNLPDDPVRHEYFICGPEPLMNIAESTLKELGIPQRRILSERFNMV